MSFAADSSREPWVFFLSFSSASGKDVYNVSDPANTWNGPIVDPEEGGLYHIYVPLYKAGSLGGAKVCLPLSVASIG